MFIFQRLYFSRTFLSVLSVGCIIALKSASAANECYFEKKGVAYCEYGCCQDGCCPMTTAAIIGLSVGAVIGLASLIGCLICLSCMLKQQSTVNKSTVIVHPGYNNTNDIYIHKHKDEHMDSGVDSVFSKGTHAQLSEKIHNDLESRSSPSSSSPDIPELYSKTSDYDSNQGKY